MQQATLVVVHEAAPWLRLCVTEAGRLEDLHVYVCGPGGEGGGGKGAAG